MFDTMYDDGGIGIACVQIGILKRIVVIDLQDDNPEHKVVLINPKITFFSQEKSVLEEGCLSVPEKRYGILRPVEVDVSFVDEFGKPHKIKADGLFADKEYFNPDMLLPIPDGYLAEGRYDDLDLIRAMVRTMIDRPDRPTCLLLPDDASYLGAQEVIRENELRIPADVSVAGYDGIPLTQSLRPHLTTVRQNNEELGRVAAQLLIRKIEGLSDAPDQQITVPVTLLKGETVGWCNNW